MKIFIVPKRVIVTVAIAVLVVLALLPVAGQKEDVPVSGTARDDLPIYSVETPEKKVAVTFNAAWDDSDIDSILTTLSAYDCRCTFFLVGTWAEKYPEAARKIREAGHEIASHSANHAHYAKLAPTEMQADVEQGDVIIKEVTGADVTLFRAPYGEYTPELVQYCRETGRYCIQWDVDSLDWKGLTATEMEARILPRLRNGSILLLHAGAEHTAEALPALLEEIRAEGYDFSTVGDMIYKEKYTVNHEGRQIQSAT